MTGLNGRFGPCADTEGGTGCLDHPPPWKITKIVVVFKQYWFGSPGKSQRYQASIPCRAIIGPPAKCYLSGVSLVGQLLVLYGSSVLLSSTKKKCCQSWTTSDKTFLIRACGPTACSFLKGNISYVTAHLDQNSEDKNI